MENEQIIQSFVVRIHPTDESIALGEQWRIKVKHVQTEAEVSCSSLEDVMQYIKEVIWNESNRRTDWNC